MEKKEHNQIKVLCDGCGCYYFWDIEFDYKDYSKAVWQTPKEAGKCCPECGSQVIAAQAHHSADFFNCQSGSTGKLPRYFSGPGSAFEPIRAKGIKLMKKTSTSMGSIGIGLQAELESLEYCITPNGTPDYLTVKFLEVLESGVLVEVWITHNRAYPKTDRMELRDSVKSYQELTDLVIEVINRQSE